MELTQREQVTETLDTAYGEGLQTSIIQQGRLLARAPGKLRWPIRAVSVTLLCSTGDTCSRKIGKCFCKGCLPEYTGLFTVAELLIPVSEGVTEPECWESPLSKWFLCAGGRSGFHPHEQARGQYPEALGDTFRQAFADNTSPLLKCKSYMWN